MANKKITDLPDIGTPDPLDVLEIVDVSTNTSKKVLFSELGGGGGSQSLDEVLAVGNTTDLTAVFEDTFNKTTIITEGVYAEAIGEYRNYFNTYGLVFQDLTTSKTVSLQWVAPTGTGIIFIPNVVDETETLALLSDIPTVANATETVAGIAEIATTSEVTTGTDDTRIVSPLKLKQSLSEVTINSLSNGLAYFLPTVGTSTFSSLLRSNAPTLSGNTGVFEAVTNILFSTTATAGTLAAQRGSPIYYTLSLISFLNYTRKFKINSNVNDTRFFCGISNMYGAAAPTNVAPDTQINTVGVCKMASSQNLQVLYNDATGLATLIDLGVNFPANNVVDYWYHLNIKKENNSTSIVVTVTRTDVTGASIVAVNTITTNYNNSIIHFPAMWICNNATATIASYKDYECISEFNQAV